MENLTGPPNCTEVEGKQALTRDYDGRTGRPMVNGRASVEELTDAELEAELTIASAEPRHRGRGLNALLLERTKRRHLRDLQPT